jgi:hypothetical protein
MLHAQMVPLHRVADNGTAFNSMNESGKILSCRLDLLTAPLTV